MHFSTRPGRPAALSSMPLEMMGGGGRRGSRLLSSAGRRMLTCSALLVRCFLLISKGCKADDCYRFERGASRSAWLEQRGSSGY